MLPSGPATSLMIELSGLLEDWLGCCGCDCAGVPVEVGVLGTEGVPVAVRIGVPPPEGP